MNAARALILMLLFSCSMRADVEHGVVLGMAPSQVRERWSYACGGRFEARTVASDLHLDWFTGGDSRCVASGADPQRPLARFEFHSGMLVAMRVATNDMSMHKEDNGAWVQVARAAHGVLSSDPLPQSETYSWKLVISLACPVHRAELARLRAEY